MTETIRIDKYLANLGVASRRNIQTFLLQNKVTLDDKRIKKSGERISQDEKNLLINGKAPKKPEYVYILVHKPKGIIATSSDEFGRANVVQSVQSSARLYPVGRLDKNSTGLVLLTNNGELVNKLTHSRYHISKTYEILVEGKISEGKLEKLRTGVTLDDEVIVPTEVRIKQEMSSKTLLEIMLFEGKKREIRRMIAALHIQLRSLKRTKIGPIALGNLQEGAHRKLTKEEITELIEVSRADS